MAVPKLRFRADDGSEFSAWEEKRLGEVCDIVGGGTPDTEKAEYWGGDINWFTPSEIGETKYVVKSNKQISKLGLLKSSTKLLPQGTILLASRATLGEMAIVKQECCTNQNFQSLIVKQECLNEFIYYYQPIIKRYCEKHASGSTFLGISKKEISGCKLGVPSLLEQRKIADLLSAVDDAITAQKAEVAAWEKRKKGVMQKLFSQEVRFKADDGSDFPAWEEKALSEIAARVTRKNKGNQTDIPLTISSLDGLVDQRDYFKKAVASKDMSGYFLLRNGEFAYNKSYSVGFDYGSIKRLDKYPCGALSTLYICFGLKPNVKVDSDYLTHYFDSQKWNPEIAAICAEGARNHGLLNVPTTDFFDINIAVPSLPEQRKIADCLTSLGDVIAKAKDELDAWQELKKGLLQQMFV